MVFQTYKYLRYEYTSLVGIIIQARNSRMEEKHAKRNGGEDIRFLFTENKI